jgi:hypothetical protein
VTNLVWSHDQFATQYASYIWVQNPHEEIIDDLGKMMSVGFFLLQVSSKADNVMDFQEALTLFSMKNNKFFPQQIFFFHDSVLKGDCWAQNPKNREWVFLFWNLLVLKKKESIVYTWNAQQLNVPKLMITFIAVGKQYRW